MSDVLLPQLPIWEAFLRGTLIYLVLALTMRLIPKRSLGNLSPNDLIALVLVGNLSAYGIVGESASTVDVLLMIVVVLAWNMLFNYLEYYVPRLRRVAQDQPTLLIHNGRVIKENLRKEKLTEQELTAGLRKHGVLSHKHVRVAVLEVDGELSVVEEEDPPRPRPASRPAED